MAFEFLQPWHEFFPREGGHVVSLFGGGGKTSLLAVLTALYAAEGTPVLVTTTTRTEPVAWSGLTVRRYPARGPEQPLPAGPVFLHRGTGQDGKWRGLSPGEVDQLGRREPDRVCLVEADGSAGLPVKLHRPGEPVWPQRTSLALAVMGLGAIGEPVAEVLHRHGRLTPGCLTGLPTDGTWTWEHLFALLAGAEGYLAQVPTGVPVVLVLCQIDSLADSPGLFAFTGRVMEEAGIPIVVFGELAGETPRLRTAVWTGEGVPNGDL